MDSIYGCAQEVVHSDARQSEPASHVMISSSPSPSMTPSNHWSADHPYQFGVSTAYRVLTSNYTYNENKRFQANGLTYLIPDQIAASHSESSGVRSFTCHSGDAVLNQQMMNVGFSLSWPLSFHILGVNISIPLGMSMKRMVSRSVTSRSQ